MRYGPRKPQNPTSERPRRSRQYSLMEFMRRLPRRRDLPDWLWSTRLHPGRRARPTAPLRGERAFQPLRRPSSSARRGPARPAGLHVHPTAGTIFHKSSTSLHLWFYAMYLMTSTRCGISAKQLERELGVTYKTAWRMFTLIRNELMTQDDDAPLSGVVEMDETYVGGKPPVRPCSWRSWTRHGRRQRRSDSPPRARPRCSVRSSATGVNGSTATPARRRPATAR